MAGSLITFTPDGGALATLGDDANRLTVQFGDVSQECTVQETPLSGGSAPFLQPKGNVAGVFAFISTKSYGSLDLMIVALKAELARINQKGTVVLTRGASTMTMAGSVLRSVGRHPSSDGVKLAIAYSFRIKTIT